MGINCSLEKHWWPESEAEKEGHMGDIHGQRGGIAQRPTSAVERSRTVRHEGRSTRPASAGIWGGRGVQITSVPSAAEESDESSKGGLLKVGTHNLSGSSRCLDPPSPLSSPPLPLPSSPRFQCPPPFPTSLLPPRVPSLALTPSPGRSSASSVSRPVVPAVGSRDRGSSAMWMVGPQAGSVPTPKGWTQAGDVRGGTDAKAKGVKLRSEKDRNDIADLERALQDAWSRGKGSKAYLNACDRLTRAYNNIAMRALQGGDNAQALELLQSAEGLIAEAGNHLSLDELKGITFNNLGCYFRREGMPMEALKWLRQAHDIEQRCHPSVPRVRVFLPSHMVTHAYKNPPRPQQTTTSPSPPPILLPPPPHPPPPPGPAGRAGRDPRPSSTCARFTLSSASTLMRCNAPNKLSSTSSLPFTLAQKAIRGCSPPPGWRTSTRQACSRSPTTTLPWSRNTLGGLKVPLSRIGRHSRWPRLNAGTRARWRPRSGSR